TLPSQLMHISWPRTLGVAVLFSAIPPHALSYPHLTNSWSVDLRTYSDSSPALAPDGTIYFGTFNGRFWALKPDGSQKWIFRAKLEIRSSPAIGKDGTIYFGSSDRNVYGLDPAGRMLWQCKTAGWVDSSTALC